MSDSIATLLTHNLHDVFGENDPERRRTTIEDIFAEDALFHGLRTGVHRGWDEIDRIAGAIRSTHPDFRYTPIREPENLGTASGVSNGLRVGPGRPDLCRHRLHRRPRWSDRGALALLRSASRLSCDSAHLSHAHNQRHTQEISS